MKAGTRLVCAMVCELVNCESGIIKSACPASSQPGLQALHLTAAARCSAVLPVSAAPVSAPRRQPAALQVDGGIRAFQVGSDTWACCSLVACRQPQRARRILHKARARAPGCRTAGFRAWQFRNPGDARAAPGAADTVRHHVRALGLLCSVAAGSLGY